MDLVLSFFVGVYIVQAIKKTKQSVAIDNMLYEIREALDEVADIKSGIEELKRKSI